MKPVGGALDPTERGEPNEDIQKDSLVPRVLPDVVEAHFLIEIAAPVAGTEGEHGPVRSGLLVRVAQIFGRRPGADEVDLEQEVAARTEWIGGQRIQGGPLRRDECVEPSRRLGRTSVDVPPGVVGKATKLHVVLTLQPAELFSVELRKRVSPDRFGLLLDGSKGRARVLRSPLKA